MVPRNLRALMRMTPSRRATLPDPSILRPHPALDPVPQLHLIPDLVDSEAPLCEPHDVQLVEDLTLVQYKCPCGGTVGQYGQVAHTHSLDHRRFINSFRDASDHWLTFASQDDGYFDRPPNVPPLSFLRDRTIFESAYE